MGNETALSILRWEATVSCSSTRFSLTYLVTRSITLAHVPSEITVSLESMEMLLVTRWERGLRNE